MQCQDEKIGALWIAEAAKSGNPIAENRLARLYAAGRGVEPDPLEAAKWHFLASAQGKKDDWLEDYVSKLDPATRAKAEQAAKAFVPELPQKASGG